MEMGPPTCPRCSAGIPAPASASPRSSPPSGQAGDSRWVAVRLGLTFEFIASVLLLSAYALTLMAAMLPLVSGGPHRVAEKTGALFPLLMVVAGLVAMASLVLVVVSRILCCFAPSRGGAKGLAIAALACLGLAPLMGLGAIMVAAGADHPPSPGVIFGLLGLAVLGLLAGHILFLLFLRAVAVVSGNASLAGRVILYLVVSLVLPVVMALLLVGVAMASARTGGGPGLALLAMALQVLVTLVLIGWYSSLVGQVRGMLAPGRAARRVIREW
jgi:MYXO-CTERM domain-containing protein